MDEASAAKLEELRLGAVSQGKEWLSRALYEMRKEELRALATAGGVQIHSIRQSLAACSRAAQLVDESLGTLHGGWVQQKNGITVPMFCGLFMWDYSYKNEITRVIH